MPPRDPLTPADTLASLLPLTPDVQAERLAELRRLFPDLFDGEGRLKPDDLKQLTGEAVATREHYEFTWNGKRHAKANAYQPATATLTFDEARSVNPDKSGGNLIIEGENLESLKCLLAAYRDSVKCIYIDPPYNTGNDFVYSDDYSETRQAYWEDSGQMENGVKLDTNPETAGRYHSNWLSMMYPRLLLARQLLRDDGVIFVSIDDHEVHNLRRLMDEVFGEECFISLIIIQSNKRGQTYKDIAKTHEYLMVFGKSEDTPLLELAKEADALPFEDERGKFDLWELRNRNPKFGRHNRANLFFPIYVCPEQTDSNGYAAISLEPSPKFHIQTFPMNSEGKESCWRWGKDKFLSEISGESPCAVAKQKRDGNWNIYEKSRKATTKAKSLWDETEVISEQGTVELGKMGLGGIFDHPKPQGVIFKTLRIATESDDLVLDFFGGSGTTAQAVLELNAQDGGNRQFILVQIPEQTPENSEARKAGYAKISDITIERVKRVIHGYGDTPKPLNAGFKVFRLTPSHFPRVGFAPDPDKTEAENVAALRAYIAEKETQLTGLFEPQDIIDEVLLKNRFKLHTTLADVPEFTANKILRADDGERQTLLCLDLKLQAETVGALLKAPQSFICLERALDTADKWNLRNHLGHLFTAF